MHLIKTSKYNIFQQRWVYEKFNPNKMLAVFWGATHSVLIDTCHRFGRTCCLRFQDKPVSGPRYGTGTFPVKQALSEIRFNVTEADLR